jgi:ApbE superfamily uncharacterized protein (UPF0280 family)
VKMYVVNGKDVQIQVKTSLTIGIHIVDNIGNTYTEDIVNI